MATNKKKQKGKKDKEQSGLKHKAVGVGQLAGAGLLGKQAIESGVPRILGVRLEQHSTSRDRARKILKEGYLDPNYGGTGAGKAIANQRFIENSKNYVHITGYHPDSPVKTNIPVLNVLLRKMQGGMYRGLGGVRSPVKMSDNQKAATVLKNLPLGLIGLKGRTMYVPGTDEYFNKEFVPDTDDIALKSNKKVKVYGSRLGATANYLRQNGLKSIPKNMLANKGRVGAGLAILGLGGAWAAKDIKKGVDKLTGSDKIKVKGYVKKGKLVKSYTRKNIKDKK